MKDQSKKEKETARRIISQNKPALRRIMVSPNEAAELFSTSPGTLGNLRSQKKGPKFFKVGSKVLYKIEDLESFFTSSPVLTLDSLREAE